MDYYSILGISKNASESDIRKAYKKQSMKHHPDRGGDEEEFKKVNEAYQTLSDPQKKSAYDNPQPNTHYRSHSGNFDDTFVNDIMSQMFGQGFARQQPMQNQTVNLGVKVTLEDVIFGKDVVAAYTLPSGKQERVEVRIPIGIRDGQKIKYTGVGDDTFRHLPRGDLHITVRVLPHKRWVRINDDLKATVDIDVFKFMLGGDVTIETIDGRNVLLKIPAGTKPGTTFNLRGFGVPDIRRGKRGNLHITAEAIIPKIEEDTIIKKLEEVRNELNLQS